MISLIQYSSTIFHYLIGELGIGVLQVGAGRLIIRCGLWQVGNCVLHYDNVVNPSLAYSPWQEVCCRSQRLDCASMKYAWKYVQVLSSFGRDYKLRQSSISPPRYHLPVPMLCGWAALRWRARLPLLCAAIRKVMVGIHKCNHPRQICRLHQWD